MDPLFYQAGDMAGHRSITCKPIPRPGRHMRMAGTIRQDSASPGKPTPHNRHNMCSDYGGKNCVTLKLSGHGAGLIGNCNALYHRFVLFYGWEFRMDVSNRGEFFSFEACTLNPTQPDRSNYPDVV